MNSCYSDVHNNATPAQAWRAGFREGVKLALDRGVKPTKEDFLKNHWRCLHWLYIWTMVGSDVENGKWAILGAREGLYKTMLTDWDYVNVRDFEYLNDLWNKEFDGMEDDVLDAKIKFLGRELNEKLNVPIGDVLSPDQSKFFKTVYEHPARTDNQRFIERL